MYYVLAVIVARVSINTASLLTSSLRYQGPTHFTFMFETASYYLGFGIVVFLLYRFCAKKHPYIQLRTLLIFIAGIFIYHTLVIFFGTWRSVWWLTSGGSQLVHYLYNGSKYIMSLRDIPLVYYYKVRLGEDILFLVMSVIGFLSGKSISNKG